MTKRRHITVAFYNLENLFDTIDNKFTNDDAFLPDSERRWNKRRYHKKIRKLGYVISQIGIKKAKNPPAIVGLAEVENKAVVNDLISSKFLKKHPYSIVHYDSPDERGIDVAFLYNDELFKVDHAETFHVDLYTDEGEVDYTRDILKVVGYLNNERIHFLVNHWPSRREGEELTNPKRLKASAKAAEIIEMIKSEEEDPRIIIMGDFNDEPSSESLQNLVNSHDLYNPMQGLQEYNRGSLNHRLKWNLFDQILFTTNFFEFNQKKHGFTSAEIFDKDFLKQYKGKYKGSPFRTYIGKKYKGGYSDHFPVYLQLKAPK